MEGDDVDDVGDVDDDDGDGDCDCATMLLLLWLLLSSLIHRKAQSAFARTAGTSIIVSE